MSVAMILPQTWKCLVFFSCVIGAFLGGTFGKVPDVGLLKSVRIKAGQMGGDWGKLTAAFTGFTSLSKVIRGR